MEDIRRKHNPTATAAVIVVCLLLIVPLIGVYSASSIVESDTDNIVFHPMSIAHLASAYSFIGYNVNQIRSAYGLPSTGGAGVTIAVIIAYDTSTIVNDLTQFSIQNNLPLPNSTNFEVHKMSTSIGVDSSWSTEACLDVEWAHAIAPDAKIVLVEATSKNSNSLFAAVQYANSRGDVDVVSMSWGSDEFSTETTYDRYFANTGIAYFASSGDDGSVIMYPSSSPYVVAVGGTTLNLDGNGNVQSETAWSGSGGGISPYESIPSYQKSYGLTGNYRSVPDVSYNANAQTGFRVYYNGDWYIIGGTSAGAPQWAGIYALGASADLNNLYQKAKSSYSTYFRDITSGATSKYSAAPGYDYVTGLGSPLTCNFEDFLTVSPTSGGPSTNVTLAATGLTGSTANVGYLNPTNQTWISLVNNSPVTQGNLTISVTVPDLMQSNPSGDSTQTYNNIVFRIQDSGSGKYYNTTAPFNEYRRGLTQVGAATATALYGNNTDLTGSVAAKGGDVLQASGVWFSPGNATLLWDNINVGNATIDQTGTFNTGVKVPTSTVGQHTLTIQDASTCVSVNVTYVPTLTTNYVDTGTWHTSDLTVNISTDTPVNETYYRINGGDIQNLTANGQPIFTAEGTNSTLEYWCTWNSNGAAPHETAHGYIAGVMLDKSAPVGSVAANSTTDSSNITLSLSAVDNVSGVTSMRFSNDGVNWSSWEPYATNKTWVLDGGDGAKTVYAQFQNAAGLASTSTCTVTLKTPVVEPQITEEPTETPTPTSTPTATQTPTIEPPSTSSPSPTPVPELQFFIAFIAIVLTSLATLLLAKSKIKN